MTYKTYKPEYTQLPLGFVNNNAALQKLIRIKGISVLAYYVVIQDKMATHSEEDFTISKEELIDDIRETLCMYDKSDEEIFEWIDALIDAGIVEERNFVSKYTDREEVRLCIPSVADVLDETRNIWTKKCISPLRMAKSDKEKLRNSQEKIHEFRKQIRMKYDAKRRYRMMLTRELSKCDTDKDIAQVYNVEIEKCEREISTLYRKLHAMESEINSLTNSDTENDDE